MRARLAAFAAVILLRLALPVDAKAGLALSPFAGMSGTTMVFFFGDMIADTDGELMELAGDYGFISGELGVGASLSIGAAGLRAEALWGYYGYNALDVPGRTYDMFMAGIEPFITISSVSIFAGGGVFRGFTHEEVLGQRVGSSRDNRGYAAWLGCGYFPYDFLEINFRVRWHHFTHIEREESDDHIPEDDVVLVLRGMLHLKIL